MSNQSVEPKRRGREVTVLAVLLVVACIIIGMLLMRPPAHQAGPAGSSPSTPAAQGSQQAQPSPAQSTNRPRVRDTARRKDGDPMAIGRVDAPVTMIEYADYACPFCARYALQTQPALVKKYVDAGKLRIEWHDLVIFGDKSTKAAIAARAAGEQGKFWEFHDALFTASPASGHPDLTDDKLQGFAKQAGVPDMARFGKDLSSGALDEAVGTDTATAQSLGARSTPVFVINGIAFEGAQPTEVFERLIDEELARVSSGSPTTGG